MVTLWHFDSRIRITVHFLLSFSRSCVERESFEATLDTVSNQSHGSASNADTVVTDTIKRQRYESRQNAVRINRRQSIEWTSITNEGEWS